MEKPKHQPDRASNSSARKRAEAVLDQALADTFPASDPVSMVQPVSRQTKLDDDADEDDSGVS